MFIKSRQFVLSSTVLAMSMILAACGSAPAAPAATSAPAAPATAAPAADAPKATEAPKAEEKPTEAPKPAEKPTNTPEPPAIFGKGDRKVVIWHGWGGDYRKAIEKIFAAYADKNGIVVELLKVDDIGNKVSVAVPTGQGPDIIAWVDDQIGKNVLSEAIQPLNDLGVDEKYLSDNFTATATKAMIYDGKVYGIPESMEALTMICNKKLITADQLPKTTDELIAKSKEYNKAPDKYLFVYNAKNDAYFSAPWWQGSGVTLVTPDGKTEIASENGVKAATLIKSFTEIMPKDIDYGVADTLFKDGKSACIMNGPWSIADYLGKGIEVYLNVLPTVSNSNQPAKPFVGVKMLMLANKAKNAKDAVEVMKFYGSTEVQTELAKVNKQVPANIKAQDAVKDDPIIAGFIAQAANGEPLPNTEFIDAMWEPTGKTVEAIWTGASAPEQAVKDGADAFDKKAKDLK